MPSVRFVLCSLTPLLDMVMTCGPVDLERNFAPLVAHHLLTRLFFWFHLTASAVLLIGSISEASDLCLNSLLALAAGLLFSCADGCDCNWHAASSTSSNHSVHTFHWRHMVHLIIQQLIDFISLPTQLVLPSRVWLSIVRTCFIHCTLLHSGIFVIHALLEIRCASRHCTDSGQPDQSSSRTPSSR